MALPQPSYTAIPGVLPLSVISPQYCLPYFCHLKIDRKKRASLNDGKFVATDINGNVIFKVKAPFFTLHNRHVLHDAAANPIVTLHNKNLTLHDRWEAFKGESTKSEDFLFSVKRSSMFQEKIELYVFLAKNTGDVHDFRVQVDVSKRSCVVYAKNSTIVAEMVNDGSFNIRVYPYTDYAFIAALLVILHNIEDGDDIAESNTKKKTGDGDSGITDLISALLESESDTDIDISN